MLGDLVLDTPIGVMSARFHRGLANAIVAMALRLTKDTTIDTVALSGGCFQNATLFQLVHRSLEEEGLTVLSHSQYPANDGGISLGQAVIALANTQEEDEKCA
jgi:hydrogenase maturation protein HypF